VSARGIFDFFFNFF